MPMVERPSRAAFVVLSSSGRGHDPPAGGDANATARVLTLIGGAAAWPFTARAQQRKIPTIGLLGAAAASVWRRWIDAFVQRLGELGWIEGHTVTIDYRWADGRPERIGEIADEFVRRNVDVIVTAESAAVAKRGRGGETVDIDHSHHRRPGDRPPSTRQDAGRGCLSGERLLQQLALSAEALAQAGQRADVGAHALGACTSVLPSARSQEP
jgi:hypothetical protein